VTTTDTTGTLKINLISGSGVFYDAGMTNAELIISEPGGKVLLDTATPVYTHITAPKPGPDKIDSFCLSI